MLLFQEWMLKINSNPGWINVQEYIKQLLTEGISATVWLFKGKIIFERYLFQRKLLASEPGISTGIKNAMFKNYYIFLKLPSEARISRLLCQYQMSVEGEVDLRNIKKIIGGPLIWKGTNITKELSFSDNEVLLIISHDGEPIYSLKNIVTVQPATTA